MLYEVITASAGCLHKGLVVEVIFSFEFQNIRRGYRTPTRNWLGRSFYGDTLFLSYNFV